ncbi:MAG: cyclodeaminase/cyclohydrolase family protein [Erysipelotrichaceae bacterium]|nr:cyclodeaminase/cyclohydrolase family protein [Erysipelotrichaceae bacterium]
MLNKSLKEFTEITFSKEPVPGGGGVSGLVGSLAASLSGMVTSLTTGKKKYAEYEDEIQSIMKQADKLRIELLEGVNKDAEAFYPLSKAYAIPKEEAGRDEKLEECLKVAADSPFNILKLTCKVIELDERLAVIGSKLAISDAATSAMFAHGALYGAYVNVVVNTRLMKDKEYASNLENEAKSLLDEYAPRAIKCYNEVLARL